MDASGFLSVLRRRLRRVLVVDGLARLVTVALAGAAVAVLADWCWTLPGFLRLIVLLGIAAGVVVAIHRRLLRPLARGMDDRALAQLAERRLPGLDGRLLSRVDGIDIGHGDGAALAQVLTPLAVGELVPAPALPRRVAMAGLAVLTVVTAAVLFPQPFRDGLSRLLLPLGTAEWERRSTLRGEIERAVVAADEPLVVRLTRSRGPDAPLRLSWWPDRGGTSGESRVLSGVSGPWVQALTVPVGTWRVLAESGDAQPVRLIGRVVTRPSLVKVEAVLTPPAYTRLPAQQLATLGCTALPGAKLSFIVEFGMEPDREVAQAGLTLAGQPLTITRSPRGMSGSLLVKSGGQLELTLADQDGIGPSPAPRFALNLAEDRKPVVSLSGPRPKEAVTARAEVALVVEAGDDYGLARLDLLARALGDEAADPGKPAVEVLRKEATTPFADVAGLPATTRKTVLAVSGLAKEGDRIVLIGRAADANDVSGPGLGESPPLELKVVTENELRQEFDRLIAEARDRVSHAREEVAGGLAKPDKLLPAARGATLAAQRAGELLVQIVRRWGENKLPVDQAKPLVQAEDLIDRQALARLAEAAQGRSDAARTADGHLAEAEKLLASLLQEGDLTRLLASLVERQKSLTEESRTFVREHLTKPLDDAAKVRQANLAARQKELSDQVKEVERRILSSTSKQLETAQGVVRAETPADRLQQAASRLGTDTQRAQAVPHQEAALATLQKVLELLRGSDAAADLAKRAGELAAREEKLVKDLQEGADPRAMAKQQNDLKEDTERLQRELNEQQKDAAKLLGAATQAQAQAGGAMQKGDRSSAESEAGAAAALLREAQKELGDKNEQKDKDKDKKKADVLALLRDLHKLQAVIVADSTVIHQRVAEKPLDFAAGREVSAVAERESDIDLRLREEGIKELQQMPIALAALGRVSVAVNKAAQHLATPALGERGLRLEKIALYELARLIEIAENLPQPKQDGGGGQQPGQGGNQAPFPPAAEIALLASAEAELAMLTAAGRPVDLAAMQHEVGKLLDVMMNASRPGSRPHLLLGRAARAMASAHELLAAGDRGLTTRHEQAAAEAALRRLMAEAKGSGGGSGKQDKNQKPQGGKPPPPSPSPGQGGSSPGGATPAAQSGGAEKGKGGDVTKVVIDPVSGQFLHLPEERREMLKEARKQNLPPAAQALFERYLELLEDGK